MKALIDFLNSDFEQTNDWDGDPDISYCPVDWELGGKYIIEGQISVTNRPHFEDWDGHSRDFSETNTSIAEIDRVIDPEGDIMELDNKTIALLISKLEL